MNVVELVAKLGVDVDESGFKKAADSISGLKKGLLGVGAAVAAGVAGFAAIVHSVAMSGDEFDALSDKLGISTDALQELKFATELGDSSFEALQTGFKILARTMDDAARGGKDSAAVFNRLGVNIKDSSGKMRPLEDMLGSIADGLLKVKDESTRLALAQKVFGRSGDQLVTFLNKGSSGIASFRQRARELGLVMSKDMVKAGAEFDDSLKDVNGAILGLKNAVGGPFIRAFGGALNVITKFIVANREVISQKVIYFFEKLSMALPYVTDALKALWWALSLVYAISKAVVSVIVDVLKWLGDTGPISAFVSRIEEMALALEDVYVGLKGGDSYFKDFLDGLGEFSSDNSFLTFLRAGVNLLINFSDPKRFTAFKAAFFNMTLDIADWFMRQVLWPFEKVLQIFGAMGSSTAKDLAASMSDFRSNGSIDILQNFKQDSEGRIDAAKAFGVTPISPESLQSFAPQNYSSQASSVQFSSQITVNATPGMDAEAVASLVVDKQRKELQEANAGVSR